MAIVPPYVAAAIQSGIEHGNKAANLDRLETLIRRAAEQGARLIVTPEMATVGSFWSSREEVAPYVEPIPGPTTERFAALARELSVYVVIGMAEVDPDTDAYYNAAALVGPDGLIGKHRKVHAYISEPLWAADGNLGFQTWDTPLGRLGMMICMDANYPESGMLLAQAQPDVLLLPTNWVIENCPAPLWMTRAYDMRAVTVATNRWGVERDCAFAGGSAILDADGTICACAGREHHDEIVLATIDLSNRNVAPLPAPRPKLYRSLMFNRHTWNPLVMHRQFGVSALAEGGMFRAVACRFDGPMMDARRALDEIDRQLGPSDKPDLVVLPEYSFSGEPDSADSASAAAEALHGPTTRALQQWCAETGRYVVAGIVERDGSILHSTLLLVGPDGLVTSYRKTHLSARESAWLTPGNRLVWADTPLGRIGLLAGSDLQRPEPARVLAIEGADIICTPASSDFPAAVPRSQTAATDRPDGNHWHLARVRAAENDTYFAFAGRNDAGIFFGPILYEAPQIDDWAVPVEGSPVGVAALDVDTRTQIGATVNPLKTKPSLSRRLPVTYGALQKAN